MFVAENSSKNGTEELLWFAMSATFGRALKAKNYLEGQKVECFVPMKYEIFGGKEQKKSRQLIPAISNLIFVHTTKEQIKTLKVGIGYLQYLTKPEGERNIPIIVPDEQMSQFMAVCNTLNEELVYLAPDEIDLEQGTPVRIIGSIFDGIEGTFVKVKKSRKKRVVVMVQGIAAVMLAEFTDGYLQVLK